MPMANAAGAEGSTLYTEVATGKKRSLSVHSFLFNKRNTFCFNSMLLESAATAVASTGTMSSQSAMATNTVSTFFLAFSYRFKSRSLPASVARATPVSM